MEYQVNNDSIMHYGVLGMKWGVRKAESSKGSSFREKRALRKTAKATNRVNKANVQLASKTQFMTVEGSPNALMVQNIKAAAKYNKAVAKYNRLMAKQMQKYGDIKIVNASKKSIDNGKHFVDTLHFERSGNTYDVVTKGYEVKRK